MDETQEVTADSRVVARASRVQVLDRCRGRCEITGEFCPDILHLHHVQPVSKGGHGYPDNLIAIRPDCHAAIHRLDESTTYGRNDDKQARLLAWLNQYFGGPATDLICAVAYEDAMFDGEKWTIRPLTYPVQTPRSKMLKAQYEDMLELARAGKYRVLTTPDLWDKIEVFDEYERKYGSLDKRVDRGDTGTA